MSEEKKVTVIDGKEKTEMTEAEFQKLKEKEGPRFKLRETEGEPNVYKKLNKLEG